MNAYSIKRLKAMAADLSSPFEAKIAQRRLDALKKQTDTPVPKIGKRPAKWLLALLNRISELHSCTAIRKNGQIYLRGGILDAQEALSAFETHRSTLAEQITRHRGTAAEKRQWRYRYVANIRS